MKEEMPKWWNGVVLFVFGAGLLVAGFNSCQEQRVCKEYNRGVAKICHDSLYNDKHGNVLRTGVCKDTLLEVK